MTKILQSKHKISRRYGQNLWGSAKSPVLRKNYKPGQHGPNSSTKLSDHGVQLKAKQLLKGYYGRITEKQFEAYYKEAVRLRGNNSDNLVGLLERRLDTVVYRLNFAATIFAARQMVSHKHIKVNGKVVNIPSYLIKPGDVIEVLESYRENVHVLEAIQKMERDVPSYLEVDPKALHGKYVFIPKLTDIPYPIKMEPHLVIEYYSS
ncbi:MAG: 30S ribosomal protein S4 [Sphingobacteriia bacterium]|nr:30S ribosomal protein S4 [Sphingobacteriia bacterium]